MTDLIILSTLLPGPKHGYQLKHEAGLILGQTALHNNLVYPLLRRFTEAGWVTRKTVPGERGQERHRYALTALGRKTLIQKLSEYSESDARSAEGFQTRVGLFQLLEPAVRECVLTGRAAHLQKKEEHLARIEERFKLDSFARETVQFLRDQAKTELNWIQHLRKISK
jgi:DNA-binding PadR family transcriptional regulator